MCQAPTDHDHSARVAPENDLLAHSWTGAHVQGVGYGIVVGFGAFFSILTTVMVRFFPFAIASAAFLHTADVLFAAAEPRVPARLISKQGSR